MKFILGYQNLRIIKKLKKLNVWIQILQIYLFFFFRKAIDRIGAGLLKNLKHYLFIND